MIFHDKINSIDDLIAMLSIQKIVYDHTGNSSDENLDGDFLPDVYYSALWQLNEEKENETFEYQCDDYGEKFVFPHMNEYYDLCREYGRLKKIKFRKNPYVTKAKKYMISEMQSIYSYCIDYMVFAPKKNVKKKYPCLFVVQTAEFWQPVQFIDALYNIRSFFETETIKLKKLIVKEKRAMNKAKIIQLDIGKQKLKENKAA